MAKLNKTQREQTRIGYIGLKDTKPQGAQTASIVQHEAHPKLHAPDPHQGERERQRRLRRIAAQRWDTDQTIPIRGKA